VPKNSLTFYENPLPFDLCEIKLHPNFTLFQMKNADEVLFLIVLYIL